MSDPSDIPLVGAPRGPVLMSAEHPNGWKLEELMPVLREELRRKCQRIEGDHSSVAQVVLANNLAAIGKLAEVEALQRNTIERLAAIGPDLGPRSTPRIGIGSAAQAGRDSSGS